MITISEKKLRDIIEEKLNDAGTYTDADEIIDNIIDAVKDVQGEEIEAEE